jgi:hypothetical protein
MAAARFDWPGTVFNQGFMECKSRQRFQAPSFGGAKFYQSEFFFLCQAPACTN